MHFLMQSGVFILHIFKAYDRKMLMQNLKDLRSVGCTFSLDDFGTGESNLNYIVELPVDIVKFDRTMIMSYFSNQKTRLMMEYVTKMIKSMNMKIVAEGVEEAHQLETLAKLGNKNIKEGNFITYDKE